MKKTIMIIMSSFLFIACGNDAKKTDLPTSVEKQEKYVTPSKTGIGSPCSLLEIDEVKNICNVAEGTEISKEKKQYTFPSCKFKWKDGSLKETKNIGGNKIEIVSNQEILLVLVENADNSMFERSTKVYKDGETVSGIGDKAIWGTAMHQLTFLAKGTMMHVNVFTSSDNEINRQNAMAIAKLMIDKF